MTKRTETKTVTIPVPISMEVIESLMTDIGLHIRYWADGPVNVPRWPLEIIEIVDHFGTGDPRNGEVKHTVTVDDVVKGVTTMAEKEPGWLARVLNEMEHDADVADVTIQYAIFGEIVYG